MSKNTQLLVIIGVFVVTLIGGFFLFQKASRYSFGDVVEVDWRLLADLDYFTGKAAGELGSLDGKPVRIPGFMVPLEDDQKAVTEFLLVPSPQACIHVPPPPPNQMVHITMDKSLHTEVANGPIWVYGILEIKPHRHMYGESSFQMKGMKVESYRQN